MGKSVVFFDGIAFVDEAVFGHGLLPELLQVALLLEIVFLQFENLFDGHFDQWHAQRLMKVELADEEHILSTNHEQATRNVGILATDGDSFEGLMKNEVAYRTERD